MVRPSAEAAIPSESSTRCHNGGCRVSEEAVSMGKNQASRDRRWSKPAHRLLPQEGSISTQGHGPGYGDRSKSSNNRLRVLAHACTANRQGPEQFKKKPFACGGPAWIRTRNQQIMSSAAPVADKEDKGLSLAESGKVRQNPQPPRNQESVEPADSPDNHDKEHKEH